MRQFAEIFQAMSMAVAFAEEGELETAQSFIRASRFSSRKTAQSRVKRPENGARKPSMRA